MPREGNRMRLVVAVLAVLLLGALVAVAVLAHKLRSSIPQIPDLYYYPKPDESSLIAFEQGRMDGYRKYTDILNKQLEAYSDDIQTTNGLKDCQSENNNHLGSACKFPLQILGTKCTRERLYGFDEGQPCVLLQMEKVAAYDDSTLCNDTKEMKRLHETSIPGYIKVSCKPADPLAKDNMGPVRFWPPGGFDLKYLPYLKQPNYLPPLVFVQFQRLRPGVLVNVECKLWSDNIRHQGYEGGTVSFSILLD